MRGELLRLLSAVFFSNPRRLGATERLTGRVRSHVELYKSVWFKNMGLRLLVGSKDVLMGQLESLFFFFVELGRNREIYMGRVPLGQMKGDCMTWLS